MGKKCIIITSYINGDINELIDFSDSFIICADGGWELAQKSGITPDVVIGDFDSSSKTPPESVPSVRMSPHKDLTDTALCIKYAAEHGYFNIFLLGGLGGRADHSIANIQNIFAAAKEHISVIMLDSQNMVMALCSDETSIPAMPGYRISLFSHSDECEGVTVSGVEYPLDNARLTSDFPLGVSNEFTESEAYIKVEKGELLIMLSKD